MLATAPTMAPLLPVADGAVLAPVALPSPEVVLAAVLEAELLDEEARVALLRVEFLPPVVPIAELAPVPEATTVELMTAVAVAVTVDRTDSEDELKLGLGLELGLRPEL